MKPSYIMPSIAVTAVPVIVVALVISPDVDKIIAEKDCGMALALGEHNLIGLSNEKTTQVISLITQCTLQGVFGGS